MRPDDKRPRGRPKSTDTHPHDVHVYLNDEEAGIKERLQQRTGLGTSALFRLALRLLARQEGLLSTTPEEVEQQMQGVGALLRRAAERSD